MAKGDLFKELEITEDTKFAFPSAGQYTAADDEEEEVEGAEDEPADEDEVEVVDAEEEEAADEQEEEEVAEEFSYEPLFQDLIAEGILYDAEGEEGYEDSPEGFRKAVLDSRDKELHKAIETLPPTAQRIMQLALKGAEEADIQSLLTLEDGPDWESVDISDEDIQRAAVEEAMRLRDPEITDEEVEEAIEDLHDLGKLQKTAEKDKKFLVKHQEAQKAAIEQEVTKREQEMLAAYEEQVKSVTTYVAGVEEIAGYKLTKADREGFLQYLTVKGKDGKTMAEKMNTPERRIQKEFLNYKDFNVSKVERQATTEVVKNVKKQLARYNKTNQNSQPVRVEREVAGVLGKLAMPADMLRMAQAK